MSGPSVDELNERTERALGPIYNRERDREYPRDASPEPVSPVRSRIEMYNGVKTFLKTATQKDIQTFIENITTGYNSRNINKFINAMRPANKNADKAFSFFFKELFDIAEGKSHNRKEIVRLYHSAFKPVDIMGRFLWESIPKGVELPKRATRKVPHTKPSRSQKGGSRSGRRSSSRRSRRSTHKNIPVRGFAVVHSAEKPWVKEANYRRWLAKLKRHTIKVRREGENEAPENMCVDSSLCKGDLGIPRKLMPQFTSPRDIRSFTTFAEKRYGIKSRRATRRAANLKPSQEEINRERVEDVQEDIVEKKLDPNVPLIVSRDGYVIDGHHRWAAYKSHHPTKKLPVLLVSAPARDVLSVAATWGAKHHQF